MTTQDHPSPLAPLRLSFPRLAYCPPAQPDFPCLTCSSQPPPTSRASTPHPESARARPARLPSTPPPTSALATTLASPARPAPCLPRPTNQTDPVLPSPERQGSPPHAESDPSVPSRLTLPTQSISTRQTESTRTHPGRHRLPTPSPSIPTSTRLPIPGHLTSPRLSPTPLPFAPRPCPNRPPAATHAVSARTD